LINVSGAILSSLLFFTVVLVSERTGLVPEVANREELGNGELIELKMSRGRPVYFEVYDDAGQLISSTDKPEEPKPLDFHEIVDNVLGRHKPEVIIKQIDVSADRKTSQRVNVSRFELSGVTHYDLVPEGTKPDTDYDRRRLPQFLFLGAAILTMGILLLLGKPLLDLRKDPTL
jgi:hypothetical protein